VIIEEDRRVFDWERLAFTVTPSVSVHGPLTAGAGTAAATTGR
jgi:hypothetical protein